MISSGGETTKNGRSRQSVLRQRIGPSSSARPRQLGRLRGDPDHRRILVRRRVTHRDHEAVVVPPPSQRFVTARQCHPLDAAVRARRRPPPAPHPTGGGGAPPGGAALANWRFPAGPRAGKGGARSPAFVSTA